MRQYAQSIVSYYVKLIRRQIFSVQSNLKQSIDPLVILVTIGNNINMIQSEEQEQGTKLILPPVSNSKPSRQLPSLQQMLSVLNRKRQEFEQQIQKQQPTDQQYNLKYARCETEDNHLDRRDLNEEESLARCSIIQNSFYKKSMKKKNRLLASNITSTLQPIRSKNVYTLSKRFDTPLASEDRYKSLESRSQQRKLSSKRQSIDKEVISQQRQTDIKDNQKKILEFALPISIQRQKSKIRTRTQSQNQPNVTKENSDISIQKINVQKFKELVADLKKGTKTNERLEKTIKALESFNPFFRKIQRVIGVCLLRMGRIKQKLANTILYNMDEPQSHFYIIMHGEVKITGRNGMHKICQTGETLLQEILDLPQIKQKSIVVPISLQKAKVIIDSWILEVDRDQFRKLQKQLNKFGFRQGLNEMKTLIKRNSIVKSWLRNKFKLLQKK